MKTAIGVKTQKRENGEYPMNNATTTIYAGKISAGGYIGPYIEMLRTSRCIVVEPNGNNPYRIEVRAEAEVEVDGAGRTVLLVGFRVVGERRFRRANPLYPA